MCFRVWGSCGPQVITGYISIGHSDRVNYTNMYFILIKSLLRRNRSLATETLGEHDIIYSVNASNMLLQIFATVSVSNTISFLLQFEFNMI
jgi:hypothetical protein